MSDLTTAGPLHRARRRESGQSDGAIGAAAHGRRAGRARLPSRCRWTAHVPRTFARTGAIGNSSSSRSGSRSRRAGGRRLEHPRVPCRHRVLLGLRRLRGCGSPCHAGGRLARPGTERVARPTRRGEDGPPVSSRKTSTISPGRRAQTTSSTPPPSNTRSCRGSRCGCCCSRNTKAKPGATSTPSVRRCDGPASGSALLLRPHHDRRSRVEERSGRDGVHQRSSRRAAGSYRPDRRPSRKA